MKQKSVLALSVILFVGLISGCAKETKRQDVTKPAETAPKVIVVKTDNDSINTGKLLFAQKCEYCHDPYSTRTIGGPGLKGILKNPFLPVSRKAATPENIAEQLRHPFTNMPSFVYLDDGDVANIIAFLNTL